MTTTQSQNSTTTFNLATFTTPAKQLVEINWKGAIPLTFVSGVDSAEPPNGNRVHLFVIPNNQWNASTPPEYPDGIDVQYYFRTRFTNMS